MPEPAFTHRACYVNFGEHLQNHWNPNLYFPGAPNRWSAADWRAFFVMIRAFGFTCFEYWLPPTLHHPEALAGGQVYRDFAADMRAVTALAHEQGLLVKALRCPNVIGGEWFFACPGVPADRQLILDLWRHWVRALPETDLWGIFPGDVGGCSRNGCTYETFIELSLALVEITLQEAPAARLELGTWGTPFSGWDEDMWRVPGWDGSWKMLLDPANATPEQGCHIWNGKPDRAARAMAYLLRRLPEFPQDMMVSINLGFSPDCHPTMGGDARPWAREVARLRPITTWDYSLAEGELINYPHWRLPRMAARRREERAAAPYAGGMTYTMTPKLNLLSLYAAGRFFLDPDADPDRVSADFCRQVFGDEALGELFEAFEVVPGWGYYPRRQWSKEVLVGVYAEIAARLAAADMAKCRLPLFPDPETYRQDLLWFAERFRQMAGPSPDREQIRKDYWAKSLAIYDVIPMSADERAEEAARQFSRILL